MAELTSSTVKDGMFNRIREQFPMIALYDESMTTALQWPHFFINQLTIGIRPDIYNRWFVDYLGTVRFRIADQLERVNNINEQLDFMALGLATAFLSPVKVGDITYRVTQTQSSEKIDGVLHWFWNATIRIMRPEPEVVLQGTLEQNFILRSV